MSLRVGSLCALLSVLACGCKNEVDQNRNVDPGPPPTVARVAFGDCVPAAIEFEVGSRPQPFEADALAAVSNAREAARVAAIRDHGTPREKAIEEARHVPILFPRYRGVTYEPGSGGAANAADPDDKPDIRLGAAHVEGDLDEAIVRRYLRRDLAALRSCYEEALVFDWTLAGTTVVSFTIAPDGKATKVAADHLDRDLGGCLANKVAAIVFPRPRGGGVVEVRVPFELRPSRSSIASGPTRNQPFDPGYQPGADNPLRSSTQAVDACFAAHGGAPWAVALIEVTADEAGAVTDASVRGLSDGAAACVVEEARKLRFAAGVTMCSMSFGEQPIAALPGVSITASEVTVGDARLAVVPWILADHSTLLRIDDLFELARSVVAEREHHAFAPAERYPYLIRAADDAPMKPVYRAVYSLRDAGLDVVFARARGNGWTVVPGAGTPPHFPPVPVPRGTGDVWTLVEAGYIGAPTTPGAAPPRLAIRVRAHDVWVGVSPGAKAERFEDWGAVAARLAKHRSSGALAESDRIESGADDDVPYHRFVEAVERARSAGFVDWVLAPPAARGLPTSE